LTTFDELRRIPLFEDLPDDAVLEVAGQGLEKFVHAGEADDVAARDLRMEAGA
jgi:hypothetical protein